MTQEVIRDLMPIPGIPQEALKQLSRQQRYKLRRYADGLCTSCGQMPRCDQSRTLCTECLGVQRERMRQRTGATRRNLASKSYVVEDPHLKAVRKAVVAKKLGQIGPKARAEARRAEKEAQERRRRKNASARRGQG